MGLTDEHTRSLFPHARLEMAIRPASPVRFPSRARETVSEAVFREGSRPRRKRITPDQLSVLSSLFELVSGFPTHKPAGGMRCYDEAYETCILTFISFLMKTRMPPFDIREGQSVHFSQHQLGLRLKKRNKNGPQQQRPGD